MKFYAAVNSYGNDVSIGFYNTWNVLAFSSRKARDEYVKKRQRENISARAIKKKEISKYIFRKPIPFSGEYFGIIRNLKEIPFYDGYVGTVDICSDYDFGRGDSERVW